jgi:hypothetical protein
MRIGPGHRLDAAVAEWQRFSHLAIPRPREAFSGLSAPWFEEKPRTSAAVDAELPTGSILCAARSTRHGGLRSVLRKGAVG